MKIAKHKVKRDSTHLLMVYIVHERIPLFVIMSLPIKHLSVHAPMWLLLLMHAKNSAKTDQLHFHRRVFE